MKEKEKRGTTSHWDPNLKTKGGYGESGRRYGLNWIEPWYGNLLNENFQIQGNPGINNGIKKNGQSWAKSCFPKPSKGFESEKK